MYRLSTTLNFYNGMKFDSLVEAIKRKRQLEKLYTGRVIDVVRDLDNKSMLIVEASAIAPSTDRQTFVKDA